MVGITGSKVTEKLGILGVIAFKVSNFWSYIPHFFHCLSVLPDFGEEQDTQEFFIFF